jgi:hypothetical protein
MINIGDQFNYGGTWYKVTEIYGDMVTTIEDPDLNRYPNVRDFTYWPLKQVDEMIEKEIKNTI